MPGQKPTKAELSKRINIIIKLLADGYTTENILRYVTLARKEDGTYVIPWHYVSPKTIDNYIAKAYKYFEESSRKIRDRELGLSYERYTELYRLAKQKGNYKDALKAQERIDKIRGLEAPIKVDETVKIEDLFEGLSPEFKEEIYRELTEAKEPE